MPRRRAAQVTEEVRNGQKVTVSLESGHQVTWAEEDNYLFPMSRLQDDLRYWVRNRKSPFPRVFPRRQSQLETAYSVAALSHHLRPLSSADRSCAHLAFTCAIRCVTTSIRQT